MTIVQPNDEERLLEVKPFGEKHMEPKVRPTKDVKQFELMVRDPSKKLNIGMAMLLDVKQQVI